eukprot:69907_1
MKATEKMGTDYAKIEKQRAIIRALKEKQRQTKMQYDNPMVARNAHRTNNVWADPHERVVKHKDIKHEKKKKKNADSSTKDKVVDPVSRQIQEERQKLKEMTALLNEEEEEQAEWEAMFATTLEKTENMVVHQEKDEDEEEQDEEFEDGDGSNESNDEMSDDLLKLNRKLLKKKCKEMRVSGEGTKM